MSALPTVPQSGYTLNVNAGTVQLAPEYAPSEGKRILRVVNASRSEAIYYAPGTEYTGSYDPATRTLTFTASTAGHSNNDELQIFIENTALPATEATQAAILGSPGTSPPAFPGGATGFQGWFSLLWQSLGLPSDAAVTNPTEAGTIPALLKGIWNSLLTLIPVLTVTPNGRLQVDSGQRQPLTLEQLQEKGVQVSDNAFLSLIEEDIDAVDGNGPGLLLPSGFSPDPLNPTGPALQFTLRDPIQLDQSVPAVIGGIDPTGAAQRARVGRDGGLQLTDGPQFIGISTAVNISPTGWIDTTGYQSIVVTFFGAPNAIVMFQATNDVSIPVAAGNVAGWPIGGANAPAVWLSSPTTGATWQFPATAKFFRVQVSTYISGTVGAVVVLRSTPATFIPNAQSVTPTANSSINLSQVGGVTPAAQGAAVSSPPLTVGGVDYNTLARRFLADSQGNQQVVGGLPTGFQFGQFNVNYGRYTQTLSSQTAAQSTFAPVIIGGLDDANTSRPSLFSSFGAQVIAPTGSDQSQQSIPELLYQILATLRAQAHYQYELAFGAGPRSAGDEPDCLIADFMNQANQFTNMIN